MSNTIAHYTFMFAVRPEAMLAILVCRTAKVLYGVAVQLCGCRPMFNNAASVPAVCRRHDSPV